eukprot:365083-Chlamydomonas_euryale.AAC.33
MTLVQGPLSRAARRGAVSPWCRERGPGSAVLQPMAGAGEAVNNGVGMIAASPKAQPCCARARRSWGRAPQRRVGWFPHTHAKKIARTVALLRGRSRTCERGAAVRRERGQRLKAPSFKVALTAKLRSMQASFCVWIGFQVRCMFCGVLLRFHTYTSSGVTLHTVAFIATSVWSVVYTISCRQVYVERAGTD